MRNVIFAINTTLDGCVDHTKGVADDETHEYFTDLLREVDLLVFGRLTYQLMVPFWPEVAKNQSMSKASNEFASTFDSINKIVFSRTLDSAEDTNTRIVRTNLHDEVLKLKHEVGKNILVGGVSVPSQLIELGLVDDASDAGDRVQARQDGLTLILVLDRAVEGHVAVGDGGRDAAT